MATSDAELRATRDDLLRIYLAGMKSGAASALANFTGATDDEVIAECAQHLIDTIEGDPLATDALAERAVQIAARVDPETIEFRAYGGCDDQ